MKRLAQKLIELDPVPLFLLAFLLDASAIAIALLHHAEILESRFFRMGREFGYWEWMEHLKMGLIIYIVYRTWKLTGEKVVYAWMVLFCVLLADNLIGIHEEIAELIINNFELPDIGLRREKDTAELGVMLVVEGAAVLYLVNHYLQAGASGRRYSHGLAVVTGIFVFFGLVFDAIGIRISHLHQLIEEPAELFTITLILVWVHCALRRAQSSAITTAEYTPRQNAPGPAGRT